MHKSTKTITLSALFLALAVMFPIAFHGVGVGSIFLPMFWPIAAAAFFLNAPAAILVGVLAPLLSSLMTGMPAISPPILHAVMLELLALSSVTVTVYQKTSWGLFWPLLIGLFFSRIVLFLFVAAIAPLFALPATVFSTAFVLKGIPGIIAIMAIVPIVVGRVKQEPVFQERRLHVTKP